MKLIHNPVSLTASWKGTLHGRALKMIQPARLLSLLLLLALPVAAQTDHSYTNSYGIWGYTRANETLTITNFIGVGNVTIPDTINGDPVVNIGANAFHDQTGLTGVIIPDSVTNIEDSAFAYCSDLTSVTIPNSLNTLGYGVFQACSLTSVTIPDSVTSVGYYAFAYCSGLTSLTIPNSVTNIYQYAFESCSGLTNVTIGNGVDNLGGFAFEFCSGLSNVLFLGNAPTVNGAAGHTDTTVFYGDPSGTVYYLPGATGWFSPTFGGWHTAMNSLVPPWLDGTALGGGWEHSSWFGDFNVNSYPWIYHAQHGWLYVFGTDPASVWLYSPGMGFLWTSSNVYPFLWDDTQQTWLYYDVGSSNPRWFYNWNQQKWTTVNP